MKQINLFDASVKVLKDEPFVETVRDIVKKNDTECPLYIMDVGDIVQKVKTWRCKMPRVKIFYAVKCNNNPYVLQILNALGTGFDCASKNEFKTMMNMGISPSRIIYAHPCKPISHIKAAASAGIDLMTFDSVSELQKIKETCPNARLVLRIRCDSLVAQVQLGLKFGLPPEQAPYMLQVAHDLGLNVMGVSFHVGSGCQEPPVFLRAIKAAREVIDLANDYGFKLTLLDIGGGFPGTTGGTLDSLAHYVNEGLEQYFPEGCGVDIIAEPGRYIVASAFTLVTKVTSTKGNNVDENAEPFDYHINDGVYGSFNCVLYDHQNVEPALLKDITPDEPLHSSIIWGPTCDSFDKVIPDIMLPKLDPGDIMYWKDMGAYTLVGASTFNGFPVPEVQMIIPWHTWLFLEELLRDSENAQHKLLVEDSHKSPPDCKSSFVSNILREKEVASQTSAFDQLSHEMFNFQLN